MGKSKFMGGEKSARDLMNEIVADHFEDIQRYIQMKLLDMPDLVDDVLMETVERVMVQGAALPQKENMTTWILGVARMTCKEFRRVERDRRRRILSLDVPVSDDVEQAHLHVVHQLSVEHPGEAEEHALELIALVLDSKTLLTERERVIFKDYWVREYSIDEVAQKYGLTKQTIYNTIYTCRQKVRAFTRRHWGLA